MAHKAQEHFCRGVRTRFPNFFRSQRVLEIGSRNINGTLRDLFEDCQYTGIDVADGDGVDFVTLAHEFAAPPASFDVVCTAEALEHDPYAALTVARMFELLRPKGLFFMTCAGPGRPEHGTERQGVLCGPDPQFYRNVSPAEFLAWLDLSQRPFEEIHLRQTEQPCDLYFFGIKGSAEKLLVNP